MKLEPVTARILAAAPSFKLAELAANLAETVQNLPHQNAAYVMPIADRTDGRGNVSAGATIQEIRETFGVLIVSRSAAGRRGGQAAEGLDALKDELNQALVGWRHPEGRGPTIYLSGVAQGFHGTAALWLSNYQVKTQLRILGSS